MKARLIVFLGVFPVCLWALEILLRWALNVDDARTFLAPAICSAALGMIGPVAVPRDLGANIHAQRRADAISFIALVMLVPGIIGWSFCMAISLRADVSGAATTMMGLQGWQLTAAMGLYLVAMLLTLSKEGV